MSGTEGLSERGDVAEAIYLALNATMGEPDQSSGTNGRRWRIAFDAADAILPALTAERDALREQVARVEAVHWRYFDDEGTPGEDDTTPAPEDVWRYDRDLRAALHPADGAA